MMYSKKESYEGGKKVIVKRLQQIYNLIEEKKGENITVLNIGKVASLADYLLIVTARNEIHLNSLSDEVFYSLKKEDYLPHHKEGNARSGWILLDYGDILVNIMTEEKRKYYNLEELWFEAEKVEV
jgi:ribosome-associated protein